MKLHARVLTRNGRQIFERTEAIDDIDGDAPTLTIDLCRDAEQYLADHGHKAMVTGYTEGDTVHMDMRMLLPLPLYVARWIALLPLRALRAPAWLDDRPYWHRLSGHVVHEHVHINDNNGMRGYRTYCADCDRGW
ncbi:hypothetical protein ACQ856_18305 [Mycolicibacterium psychrotolerans]|uniref:hypothetical protein n=1 Tax=Mycolicibacterium psychrotolerans TaxID=216929 RepID=UPI003D67FCE9